MTGDWQENVKIAALIASKAGFAEERVQLEVEKRTCTVLHSIY